MPKIFLMLALLAHGAVAVRSNTWLSEGQLDPEKVEKKPQFVENFFDKVRKIKDRSVDKARKIKDLSVDKARKIKDWSDRKLEEKKQKDIDVIQERLKRWCGISATRYQVEVFLRRARKKMGLWPRKWDRWDLWNSAVELFPLDVGASAVAFCGELVKAAGASLFSSLYVGGGIARKLRGAEEICLQVLTGDLSSNSGAPKWAVNAAQVAEMDHQQHPYGRLDGVAWKHSLKRVCHDECHELVQGMQEKAKALIIYYHSPDVTNVTVEDACADEVVKRVEAEILGCCSKSCGWNGHFCAFFPFLNSTEQADWQAECCAERNILKGSTRQQMCDSTLSQADKIESEKIVDQRPNNEKDREILGQDESRDSKSWSLMERSFGESVDHKCSPPLNLHQIHKELREKEWKRIQYDSAYMDKRKRNTCQKKQEYRGECKAFLLNEITHDQNKKIFKYEYICLESCDLKPPAFLPPPPNSILEDLTNQAQSATNFLYVHKKIYSTWKLTWTHINITWCFERIDQQSVDENESLARVSWKELFLGAWSCLQTWYVSCILAFSPHPSSLSCARHLVDKSSSYQSGKASQVSMCSKWQASKQFGREARAAWGECSDVLKCCRPLPCLA